ncbi:MAG: cupin domain-containing protein [Gemmatimonadota bacterium]
MMRDSGFLALALAGAIVLASCRGSARPPHPAGAWNPNSIQWQPADSDGTKWAVLEGRTDAPDAFTYAYFVPAGHWEHHSHTADARVAVISGALRVSYGDHLDSTTAQVYPAGSFLLVPANAPHTMGATTNTIIIGTAVGPWKTHYAHTH